jgi:hypothetical protein
MYKHLIFRILEVINETEMPDNDQWKVEKRVLMDKIKKTFLKGLKEE